MGNGSEVAADMKVCEFGAWDFRVSASNHMVAATVQHTYA